MRQRLEIFFFHLAIRVLAFLMAGHLPAFVVVAALLVEDGRILFVRRRDGRGLNLPGGYLGRAEEPHEGAAREVEEETGYLVEIAELLEVYGPRARNGHLGNVLLLFQVRRVGGRPRGSHEGDPVWRTPTEALRERLDSGLPRILHDFQAGRWAHLMK